MKPILSLIFTAVMVSSCLVPPGSSGGIKAIQPKAPESSASAKKIVDENFNILLSPPEVEVQNRPIPGFNRGLNFGNALEAPSLGEWGVVLDEDHFRLVKKAGFDHVRLPARFSGHAQDVAPYTIDEEFFKYVDWAIDQATQNGLGIIVDLHHYEELMKDPTNHAERYRGLWKQIAERYRDQPASVAFELLNEPCDQLTVERLDPLMKETLTLVRQTNPDRLVFVDCYFWANTEWLDRMDTSYFDDNTIATFHMYQHILFTHQGAPWMSAEYQVASVIFPGPPASPVEIKGAALSQQWAAEWLTQYNTQDAATNPSGPRTIWEEFDRATAFVKKTGIRVYMGEFGAIDFADARSRTIFLKMVRRESERRGIGWAYWDDGGHNRGLDVQTGTWNEAVAAGLFDR